MASSSIFLKKEQLLQDRRYRCVPLIEERCYSVATTPEALPHLANRLSKRPNRGNLLSIYANRETALVWAVANLRKGALIINVHLFQLFANHWLRASSDLPTHGLYGADIFTRKAETSMRIIVFAVAASLLLTGCITSPGWEPLTHKDGQKVYYRYLGKSWTNGQVKIEARTQSKAPKGKPDNLKVLIDCKEWTVGDDGSKYKYPIEADSITSELAMKFCD